MLKQPDFHAFKVTTGKVYEHVIDGLKIRTNLSVEDLASPKLWTMRSVRTWAHAIHDDKK